VDCQQFPVEASKKYGSRQMKKARTRTTPSLVSPEPPRTASQPPRGGHHKHGADRHRQREYSPAGGNDVGSRWSLRAVAVEDEAAAEAGLRKPAVERSDLRRHRSRATVVTPRVPSMRNGNGRPRVVVEMPGPRRPRRLATASWLADYLGPGGPGEPLLPGGVSRISAGMPKIPMRTARSPSRWPPLPLRAEPPLAGPYKKSSRAACS